ncbi:hypothetical protein H6F75_18215 [Nodosilinea sp. FACHB-131]|uniref:hypothetical protein n=1 Tax=Cyanophyceae TaxID=3028117 RepID=UPI0016822FE6|nr:hypothetical protein [Nodosilinea sp. FACHB-131]MBD1875421.1 hypothetical protein [Nodosilinea sp. FACHB-131]
MHYRSRHWVKHLAIAFFLGGAGIVLGQAALAQTWAAANLSASAGVRNLWLIAGLLSLWLFVPLIATVIISLLAFRVSPTEGVEASGENVIKVLPGLNFKARGPTATFIILIGLSSLIVLSQIGNVIAPINNDFELNKVKQILVDHGIIDSTDDQLAGLNLDGTLGLLNTYITETDRGLNPWTLSTKVGLYRPDSSSPSLMSDSEVRRIVNERTLEVRVESVPKVEPPFGTNVVIEKLLYFPIGAKTTADIQRAIEDSSDGVNLGFSVVRPGDSYHFKQAANLKGMSLSGQLDYQSSSEGQGPPAICDPSQEKLTLSINFQDRRVWLGPCVLLDYEPAS